VLPIAGEIDHGHPAATEFPLDEVAVFEGGGEVGDSHGR
jgi:hypothetical protein